MHLQPKMKALMLDFDDMLYLTPPVLVTWWYYARYGYLMRENMLCAGEEGKDSCSGDQVCLYCTIATYLTMHDHQIGLQVTAEVPWSVLLERRGVWCWLGWLLGARVVEGKKRGLWKVLAYKVGCKGWALMQKWSNVVHCWQLLQIKPIIASDG